MSQQIQDRVTGSKEAQEKRPVYDAVSGVETRAEVSEVSVEPAAEQLIAIRAEIDGLEVYTNQGNIDAIDGSSVEQKAEAIAPAPGHVEVARTLGVQLNLMRTTLQDAMERQAG